MLRDERIEKIKVLLQKSETVRVAHLSELLNVTSETIRKDLEYLEDLGEVRRVHGGAILKQSNTKETNFSVRETINKEQKAELASLTTAFVKEGDCIALDVSTTNTEVIKQLATSFQQLSIVTNCLSIATIAAQNPNFSIFLTGGILKNSELCLVGQKAVDFVEGFHIDTFFMSASGVSLDQGFLDYGLDELSVKQAMLRNATSVFAVMDYTKFNKTAIFKVGGLAIVDGIITNPALNEDIVHDFKEAGVTIYVE